MKFDTVIKGVFALAALLAAVTYTWSTFVDRAEPVAASGVDTKEGITVEGLGFNRNGGIVCVTRYSEHPFEPGQMRHTMTFYELVKSGSDGTAKLYLMGSRCLDYDQGPDLIKFEEIKGETPKELKEAMEKAGKGKRR